MRTTLILPHDLLEAARASTGCATKTETVVYALKEVVRRKKVEALKAMLGTVNVQVDLVRTRGRRGATAS